MVPSDDTQAPPQDARDSTPAPEAPAQETAPVTVEELVGALPPAPEPMQDPAVVPEHVAPPQAEAPAGQVPSHAEEFVSPVHSLISSAFEAMVDTEHQLGDLFKEYQNHMRALLEKAGVLQPKG